MNNKNDLIYKADESLGPGPSFYFPKDPNKQVNVTVKINQSPLNREKFLVQTISPCLTSLKPTIIKPHQVKPSFFNLMSEVEKLEHQFKESMAGERKIIRRHHEKIIEREDQLALIRS